MIRVTAMTHRKNPISYGLICGRKQDYPRPLLRGSAIRTLLQENAELPSVRQVHYFDEAGRAGFVAVSAAITDPGEPRRIMEAVWNNVDHRWVIVTDEDCDVSDIFEVFWRVASSVEPEQHIFRGPKRDRSQRTDADFTPPSCGMGIDATFKFKDKQLPRVNKVSKELLAKVATRWEEFGLP